MRLFDTHVHLNQFDDINTILRRAKEAGVDKILTAGVDLDSNKELIQVYKKLKNFNLYLALGVHPYQPQTDTLNEAYDLIQMHKNDIAAVGEIGLDYFYNEAKEEGPARDLQKEIFRKQLALAKEINKPVIIHSRAAARDCLDIAENYGLKKVLFHWYTGPLDILKIILEKGYFISVSPAVEYSKPVQEAVMAVPTERILIETDSPVRYRPKRGSYMAEPKDTLRVLEAISDLKKTDKEDTAEKIYQSSCKFFNIELK
jgi:TatD DNase family protein